MFAVLLLKRVVIASATGSASADFTGIRSAFQVQAELNLKFQVVVLSTGTRAPSPSQAHCRLALPVALPVGRAYPLAGYTLVL